MLFGIAADIPPAPSRAWLAIGWGEGGAQDCVVRSTAEMVDWLWDQCGPDHTGDEGLTRVYWSEYLLEEDNWQHLDDVRRWRCKIDIGETGHVEFIGLLGTSAYLKTAAK
jgi:hypothetical protein